MTLISRTHSCALGFLKREYNTLLREFVLGLTRLPINRSVPVSLFTVWLFCYELYIVPVSVMRRMVRWPLGSNGAQYCVQ